jgi:hypothetical protein
MGVNRVLGRGIFIPCQVKNSLGLSASCLTLRGFALGVEDYIPRYIALYFATSCNIDVALFNTGVIFTTMSNGDSNNPLLEAAEKLRREAYAQGWRDAVAALSKAAAEVIETDSATPLGAVDYSTLTPPGAASGVIQGSTPWYVLQAVRKRPGMAGSEVVSAVQEGGHRVSDGSIRTSLARLGEKKLIVSRHRKWFPA